MPMSTGEKFVQMFIAIALFFGVVAVILLITARMRSRRGEVVQSTSFVLPALALVALGLVYPAVGTIKRSFYNKNGQEWVGSENYREIFTDPALLRVLANTGAWVILVPLLSTLIGLVYAVMVDRARFEKFAKALIFLPMAISLVGASIIWRFVYAYKEIGIANAVLQGLGFNTYNFRLEEPWNTFFLIVVMIWVQAGFAMTILAASIRGIPDDIVEAARLDGVGGFKMFRYITVPSIRASLIVVLKAFDIVRTMTGGNFDTSVLAYEFYFRSFRAFDQGLGAALGVVIFVLVIPIVIYNVRQMRKLEAR
jgi:alpha-glucoside transport system permease protein